jgi:hypothetical protein
MWNSRIFKTTSLLFGVGFVTYALYRWYKQNDNLLPYYDKKRISRVCPLCNTSNHDFRSCNIFSILKRNTTKTMYCDKKLRPQDEAGFTAAAIIPMYTKCISPLAQRQILLTKERRGNIVKHNFAGGKRDSRAGENGFRFETSLETAIEEFSEEIEPLLSKENYTSFMMEIESALNNNRYEVIWIPNSKAAAYIVQVSSEPSSYICKHKLNSEEAVSFTWYNLSTYDTWMPEVHDFVKPFLNFMVDKYINTI